jgi:hypothetical protein
MTTNEETEVLYWLHNSKGRNFSPGFFDEGKLERFLEAFLSIWHPSDLPRVPEIAEEMRIAYAYAT